VRPRPGSAPAPMRGDPVEHWGGHGDRGAAGGRRGRNTGGDNFRGRNRLGSLPFDGGPPSARRGLLPWSTAGQDGRVKAEPGRFRGRTAQRAEGLAGKQRATRHLHREAQRRVDTIGPVSRPVQRSRRKAGPPPRAGNVVARPRRLPQRQPSARATRAARIGFRSTSRTWFRAWSTIPPAVILGGRLARGANTEGRHRPSRVEHPHHDSSSRSDWNVSSSMRPRVR
jgi:hypothetical protein